MSAVLSVRPPLGMTSHRYPHLHPLVPNTSRDGKTDSQEKVKQTQTKYHEYRVSTQTEELLYSWPMQAIIYPSIFYEK